MLKTDRLVITEGKYDKIKLESVLDAFIITTEGFGIFKDKQKTDFIRRYAQNNGILIITDSDAAGFVIRNYIASIVPPECIMNAYIPEIKGKEKRKAAFSSEGKLGVEGIETGLITEALKKAGIEEAEEVAESHTSSYDLFEAGFYGKANSKQLRQKLLLKLGLPLRISQKNLLKYINRNFSREAFSQLLLTMEDDNVQSISETR